MTTTPIDERRLRLELISLSRHPTIALDDEAADELARRGLVEFVSRAIPVGETGQIGTRRFRLTEVGWRALGARPSPAGPIDEGYPLTLGQTVRTLRRDVFRMRIHKRQEVPVHAWVHVQELDRLSVEDRLDACDRIQDGWKLPDFVDDLRDPSVVDATSPYAIVGSPRRGAAVVCVDDKRNLAHLAIVDGRFQATGENAGYAPSGLFRYVGVLVQDEDGGFRLQPHMLCPKGCLGELIQEFTQRRLVRTLPTLGRIVVTKQSVGWAQRYVCAACHTEVPTIYGLVVEDENDGSCGAICVADVDDAPSTPTPTPRSTTP